MKSIVRIVHLPSVVQSEFNEATRTLFLRKENKTTTLFNNSSPLVQRSTILENIRWTQAAYALVCQPRHKDTSSTFVYALIWMKQRIRYAADTEACTLHFSKMVLRWTRGNKLLNKVVVLFSLHGKSVLVASLNSDWTTDGRWTVLIWFVFHTFLGLDTVLFIWQSMGQSQASRFASKISQIVFQKLTKLLRVWNDMG